MDTMDADGGILAGKLREDDTPTRNLILCVDEAICDIRRWSFTREDATTSPLDTAEVLVN